jgi:glycosyltransferase involved in cell wall biosynthesis
VRILLVSSMYPGRADPDFGVFVAQLVGALERRGHEVERAVVDHRGGSKAKQLTLTAAAFRGARRTPRPDVIYAHFLAPAGVVAAAASVAGGGTPLVLTAHGRDVRNLAEMAAVRMATRLAARRSAAVVAVSGWLRDRLVAALPELAGRVEVIDCGVDLDRFTGGDPALARARLGIAGPGPHLLHVGTLDERKNVIRLAEAFARLGRGTLTFVGDGPLRPRLEGRPGVRVVGRIPHADVPAWITACEVLCLPSIDEPFGQVLIEAMASERSVVAGRCGGPAELVKPGAGALVDPLDPGDIVAGLERAIALGTPNPAARALAAEHGLDRQAERVESVLLAAVARGAGRGGG